MLGNATETYGGDTTVSGTNADAPVIPPWLPVLKESVKRNTGMLGFSRIHLAGLRPDGRPLNRSLTFRGFALDTSSYPSTPTPPPPPTPTAHTITQPQSDEKEGGMSPLVAGKMASLMVFGVDVCDVVCVRGGGGSVSGAKGFEQGGMENAGRMVVGDDGFVEACWSLPHTTEEYRLSGRAYLISTTTAGVLNTPTCLPPWAPRKSSQDIWQSLRSRTWTSLSDSDQRSFGPEGYKRFAVLVMDVDGVEHRVVKEGGEKMVTRYTVVVPKRTYGRIIGVQWRVVKEGGGQ
ncbi:hypothetical protein HK104_007280 [Borealophlyctis nickersoniae]|nr:hypothetical protein HK104_007280 [Borealophlyctis nickersoniae]